MAITFVKPELQSNESFKGFEDVDSLGTSYLDLSGKVAAGSLDLLPEEMRKDPAIAAFKSIPELARGYVETKKMVGGIEKAPEKPDGYKFTAMTGLHEKVKAEGILKSLAPILHGAGVGNKSADMIQQGLLKTLSDLTVQQDNARKDNLLKNETTLRGEWGAEYDARMDKMQKIWAQVGGTGNVKETGLENVKALAKLTSFLSEDSLGKLGETPTGPITDKVGAQKEIDKYMGEITAKGKLHPYFNDKDPGHEEAKKKMHDLHDLLK
jgi:hypothetical protein